MAWHFRRTTFKLNWTRFYVTDFCNSAVLNKTFQCLVSCVHSYVRFNLCGFAWERHILKLSHRHRIGRLLRPTVSTIGLLHNRSNPSWHTVWCAGITRTSWRAAYCIGVTSEAMLVPLSSEAAKICASSVSVFCFPFFLYFFLGYHIYFVYVLSSYD